MSDKDDLSAMSFEAALGELERIVAQLESGNVELEKSIALYERGAKLRQYCEDKLKAAKLKVERIVLDGQGQVRTEPQDTEQDG